MATNSIMRSVTVKNANQCRKLVSALERAEASKKTDNPMTKTVHEMTPDQIREIFGKGKE